MINNFVSRQRCNIHWFLIKLTSIRCSCHKTKYTHGKKTNTLKQKLANLCYHVLHPCSHMYAGEWDGVLAVAMETCLDLGQGVTHILHTRQAHWLGTAWSYCNVLHHIKWWDKEKPLCCGGGGVLLLKYIQILFMPYKSANKSQSKLETLSCLLRLLVSPLLAVHMVLLILFPWQQVCLHHQATRTPQGSRHAAGLDWRWQIHCPAR